MKLSYKVILFNLFCFFVFIFFLHFQYQSSTSLAKNLVRKNFRLLISEFKKYEDPKYGLSRFSQINNLNLGAFREFYENKPYFTDLKAVDLLSGDEFLRLKEGQKTEKYWNIKTTPAFKLAKKTNFNNFSILKENTANFWVIFPFQLSEKKEAVVLARYDLASFFHHFMKKYDFPTDLEIMAVNEEGLILFSKNSEMILKNISTLNLPSLERLQSIILNETEHEINGDKSQPFFLSFREIPEFGLKLAVYLPESAFPAPRFSLNAIIVFLISIFIIIGNRFLLKSYYEIPLQKISSSLEEKSTEDFSLLEIKSLPEINDLIKALNDFFVREQEKTVHNQIKINQFSKTAVEMEERETKVLALFRIFTLIKPYHDFKTTAEKFVDIFWRYAKLEVGFKFFNPLNNKECLRAGKIFKENCNGFPIKIKQDLEGFFYFNDAVFLEDKKLSNLLSFFVLFMSQQFKTAADMSNVSG